MKPEMNQTIVKVSMRTNRYGDTVSYSPDDNENLTGKFREITDIQTGRTNMESIGSDAMAWFNPEEDISKGDIISIEGDCYKVEKLVKARSLSSSTVEFIKTYLSKFNLVS